MKNDIVTKFGGKVRVRACGVLIDRGSILMVKHLGLGDGDYLWIPPGGGVDRGMSIEETIIKEFREETGLEVEVKDFLFINEFIESELHAIEVFFQVAVIGGELMTGIDPEMSEADQIIDEVRFLNFEEMKSEKPENLHQRFRELTSIQALLESKGFFNFKNIYLK